MLQVSRTGCRLSILGGINIENPTGPDPEKPALAFPVLAGGDEPDDLQGCLPTSAVIQIAIRWFVLESNN